MRMLAAVADQPYIVTALATCVGVLFAALGKVALELLRRGDQAHADIVALWQQRLMDSEARAEEWRALALEEHGVTKDAVDVAKARAPK
jgi:hypothetical protein